jgi:hypothetical protein
LGRVAVTTFSRSSARSIVAADRADVFFRNAALSVGCILRAMAAGLIVVAPGKSTVVLGPALYIGAVLFSLAAIVAHRKLKKLQGQLVTLQTEVNYLNNAEKRRLLRDIRRGDPRSKKINKRVGIRPLRSSVRWRNSLSESVQHMWDGKSDG